MAFISTTGEQLGNGLIEIIEWFFFSEELLGQNCPYLRTPTPTDINTKGRSTHFMSKTQEV